MDLATERENAARRRLERSRGNRARSIVRRLGRTAPPRELEELVRATWKKLPETEVHATVSAARALQEESQDDHRRMTETQMANHTKATQRAKDIARKRWEKDPQASHLEVFEEILGKGVEIAWSTFKGHHGPAIRRELGIVGGPMRRTSAADAERVRRGRSTALNGAPATPPESPAPVAPAPAADPVPPPEATAPEESSEPEPAIAPAGGGREALTLEDIVDRLRVELEAARTRASELETAIGVLERLEPAGAIA